MSSVPFEVVAEEEMLAIEAALQQAERTIAARRHLPRARCTSSASRELEDLVKPAEARPLPVLLNLPPKRSLCVTDVTSLEWCERQFELSLTLGKPKRTSAMKAGNARHSELESDVVTRVEVDVQTKEDSWAVRLMNFMLGARQLLAQGMTRELPVIAFVEGVWITGIIDELQLHHKAGPCLVDTKTRLRQCLPSEAQKRNGRLQLMCYKLLWDTMCEQGVPSASFLSNFQLEARRQLSYGLLAHLDIALGYKVKCLEDLLQRLQEMCPLLPAAQPELKLRYEWQVDNSLLGEEEFQFDRMWLTDRLRTHLDFWLGRRRQSHTVWDADDAWKCHLCPFVEHCRPKQRGS